jgi:hypothetical protein
LEVWDTPLIPVDAETVLLVPAVIGSGSPVRAIENIIAQWDEDLFKKRGKILEKRIKEIFSALPGVQVQNPVIFCQPDGKEVECDVVVWWGSHLFLIESKCTKSIYSPADAHRARNRVEEAVDQLNIRLEAIEAYWTEFKAAANQLSLPEEPLRREDIELIAATNVTQFTGQYTADVKVIDEFIIDRFFGPKDITISDGFRDLGVVEHIRHSTRPTAEEFISYISYPPQIDLVKDHLQVEPVWLPLIKESDPAIGFLDTSYVPMEIPTESSERLSISPTGGKISRNSRCPCGSGRKYKGCCGRNS